MSTLVELCAGTAAVSLWALGRCSPLTGYMGSKRRWAPVLVEALGVDRPDRIVLVEAGSWADAWSVLSTAEGRDAVRFYLHDLDATNDLRGPGACWSACLDEPSAEPGRRVAAFLVLQANQVRQLAVRWNADRWVDARGHRPSPAAPSSPNWRALLRPRTIAQRVVALGQIDWTRVEIVHGDVRAFDPVPGSVVYLDPPYVSAVPYGPADLTRAEVLDLAQRHAAAGARVAVSEGEPLPLDGWVARRLHHQATGAGGGGRISREEWVTASWPISIEEQLALWRAA